MDPRQYWEQYPPADEQRTQYLAEGFAGQPYLGRVIGGTPETILPYEGRALEQPDDGKTEDLLRTAMDPAALQAIDMSGIDIAPADLEAEDYVEDEEQERIAPVRTAVEEYAQEAMGQSPGEDGSPEVEQGDLGSSEDDIEEGGEELGEDDSGAASQAQRQRRRNILPRILRGQRCGHCHTCLNPQMKKACLTMRQKQMDDMRKKGELPVSLMAQTQADSPPPESASPTPSPPPASGPARAVSDFSGLGAEPPRTLATASAAAAKHAEPTQDLFSREIQAIVNRNGGVEARFLPSLQRLYQKESQLQRKLVLMTVLKRSPGGTLREAVRAQKIIVELQRWLQSAAEAKDVRLASRVVEMLDTLPIDLPALQSTGIGKTLAKLRKSGPEELRKPADALVTKWKKAVDNGPAPGAEAAKRPREAATEAAVQASKRIKSADPLSKAGKTRGELPRQSSVDSKDDARPKASGPMEVDDTAMFERKRPAASLQDSVVQMRKAHQIKVLSEEASKKLKTQEAGAEGLRKSGAPDSSGSGDSPDGSDQPQDAAKEEGTKLGGRPPPSAFASASLSMPLGSSRLTGTGTGITRIGGMGSSLSSLSLSGFEPPMDAAARAAAAAARVPDPVEAPRRQKAKKVSWFEDEKLVLVRWFRQVDPVVAVKEDAKETTEIDTGAPATAEEPPPPGFVNAAKREHQNEAAALRQQRQDAKEEEDAEAASGSKEAAAAAAPVLEAAAVAVPAESSVQLPAAPARSSAQQPPPPASAHVVHSSSGPAAQFAPPSAFPGTAPAGAPAARRWAPMIRWPLEYHGPPFATDHEREYQIPTDEEQKTAAYHLAAENVERQPEAVYADAALAPFTPLEPLPDDSQPIVPLSIPCPRMEPAPRLPPSSQPTQPLPLAPQAVPPQAVQPQAQPLPQIGPPPQGGPPPQQGGPLPQGVRPPLQSGQPPQGMRPPQGGPRPQSGVRPQGGPQGIGPPLQGVPPRGPRPPQVGFSAPGGGSVVSPPPQPPLRPMGMAGYAPQSVGVAPPGGGPPGPAPPRPGVPVGRPSGLPLAPMQRPMMPPPRPEPPAHPMDLERALGPGARGRGRGRWGRGDEGGQGRWSGRGRRPPDDSSGGRGGRGRRPGEGPRPPHLIPCRWHFGGGQGCRNGDNCRFSHTIEPST